MKILNFGSLNIDYVYRVNSIVTPGETVRALDMHEYCGGKGLNQSIAIARAGAKVYHAGMIENSLSQCAEPAALTLRISGL